MCAGGFNVSDATNQSLLFPQRRQARLSQDGRGNHGESFWRDLFTKGMMEIESPIPTHYSRSNETPSTIDRFFISLSTHFVTDCDETIDVIQDAPRLSDWALSDHAILVMRLAPNRFQEQDMHSKGTSLP